MSELTIDCDAILFDMDGTLVDSRALVERMWLLWAAEHGIPADAVLAVAHGRRTYETMQLVAPSIATPEAAAALDAREAEEDGGETAIPGAAALLEALPRRPMGRRDLGRPTARPRPAGPGRSPRAARARRRRRRACREAGAGRLPARRPGARHRRHPDRRFRGHARGRRGRPPRRRHRRRHADHLSGGRRLRGPHPGPAGGQGGEIGAAGG